MLTPGLVSITFRKLTVPEIIHLVRKAGLKSIEWGGDVHVPHGKLQAAEDARKRTEDAGLAVAAYGSYYRVGKSEKEQTPFEQVLETAALLKAPTIRVWAGEAGSAKTTDAARKAIVRKTRQIAMLAAEEGITVSLEFHRNTLTDTPESTLEFLKEVNHPNVLSLWQPPIGADRRAAADGLRLLLPHLGNLHVFHWSHTGEGTERLPLSKGSDRWQTYLDIVRESGRDHHALIEFVRDDDPAAVIEDAATLRSWLERGEVVGC